jgi:hypothetical protein
VGAWGNGTNATETSRIRSGEQLLTGLIQAAQTHNNQSSLDLIHLRIKTRKKQVKFEAENELLTGLIQAAQIHNNQSSLESIHLQIKTQKKQVGFEAERRTSY